MKAVIVLARLENTGLRTTGKLIRPDGVNWREETECCQVAKSMVWSSEMTRARLGQAEAFAAKEGYKVLILPDTSDVLEVARKAIMPA